VALAQESLHSVKKKKLKDSFFKLDLSKAYDRVNWTFLQLVLIQLGMNLEVVNWIIGSLNSALFVVLMNGAPYFFFKASRGLCLCCPMSPFLFLIIAETLSRLLKEAINYGRLRGLKVIDSRNDLSYSLHRQHLVKYLWLIEGHANPHENSRLVL
jgi:hypothetical protein